MSGRCRASSSAVVALEFRHSFAGIQWLGALHEPASRASVAPPGIRWRVQLAQHAPISRSMCAARAGCVLYGENCELFRGIRGRPWGARGDSGRPRAPWFPRARLLPVYMSVRSSSSPAPSTYFEEGGCLHIGREENERAVAWQRPSLLSRDEARETHHIRRSASA